MKAGDQKAGCLQPSRLKVSARMVWSTVNKNHGPTKSKIPMASGT